jgi:hypothetical protein
MRNIAGKARRVKKLFEKLLEISSGGFIIGEMNTKNSIIRNGNSYNKISNQLFNIKDEL